MKLLMWLISLGLGLLPSLVMATSPYLEDDMDSYLTAVNRLGAEVFAAESLEREGNVVVSPLSLGTALTLLAQGADDDTRSAFAQGLGTETVENAAAAYQQLAKDLSSGGALGLANSLWSDTTAAATPDFVTDLQAYFAGEAFTVDMQAEETLGQINRWVSDATAGEIPALLEALSPATTSVLLNALYFKDRWAVPFDPEATVVGTFTQERGDTLAVPLMQATGRYFYQHDEHKAWLALPFVADDSGHRFVALFVLPEVGHGEVMQADLAELDWTVLMRQAMATGPTNGEVVLPRMQLRHRFEVLPRLQAAGWEPMLGAGADFSRLSATAGLPGRILQEATVRVDEEGAEGSAATAIVLERALAARPFSFRADRPFYLAVLDERHGMVVFLARVAEPV